MRVWLVSPAWGRQEVTRIVLAQRRHMCDLLATRGIEANSVIIADDENLDIAREYGFHTVEMDNSDLGARFNAGYQYAGKQGADFFAHVGSDDWVHPDTFDILHRFKFEPDTPSEGVQVWKDTPCIVAQRDFMMVNLLSGKGASCFVPNRLGVIPWIIPRSVLEPEGFAPIKKKGLMRGLDGALSTGLQKRPNWVLRDSEPWWLVDWKSDTNITGFKQLVDSLAKGKEYEPFNLLRQHYPRQLVNDAQRLAAQLFKSSGDKPPRSTAQLRRERERLRLLKQRQRRSKR